MVPAPLGYNRRMQLVNRFLAAIGVGGTLGAVVWGLTAWDVIDEGVAWIGAGAVIGGVGAVAITVTAWWSSRGVSAPTTSAAEHTPTRHQEEDVTKES